MKKRQEIQINQLYCNSIDLCCEFMQYDYGDPTYCRKYGEDLHQRATGSPIMKRLNQCDFCPEKTSLAFKYFR